VPIPGGQYPDNVNMQTVSVRYVNAFSEHQLTLLAKVFPNPEIRHSDQPGPMFLFQFGFLGKAKLIGTSIEVQARRLCDKYSWEAGYNNIGRRQYGS